MSEDLPTHIELALKKTAHESMGIYPRAVDGVPRNEWKEGWNQALIELARTENKFERWFCGLDPWVKEIVGRMLAADAIFLQTDENNEVRMCYDSSDLFAWGYADCEIIENNEQLRAVHEAWKEHPNWGIKKRLCKLEREKPQGPVETLMREAGAWDYQMDALPPNQYDRPELYGLSGELDE